MEIDHIDVQVYGPRNYLLGHVRIPATVVPQLPKILADTQIVNPAYSYGSLVRWMVKAGYNAVQHALKRGAVPVPSGE